MLNTVSMSDSTPPAKNKQSRLRKCKSPTEHNSRKHHH